VAVLSPAPGVLVTLSVDARTPVARLLEMAIASARRERPLASAAAAAAAASERSSALARAVSVPNIGGGGTLRRSKFPVESMIDVTDDDRRAAQKYIFRGFFRLLCASFLMPYVVSVPHVDEFLTDNQITLESLEHCRDCVQRGDGCKYTQSIFATH
jgi:hypothetical protein